MKKLPASPPPPTEPTEVATDPPTTLDRVLRDAVLTAVQGGRRAVADNQQQWGTP